ncbi:VOC family protein [Maribacter sp. CXY002]|uniref:VOC family protein n=1 Tax=Maribacter luteocoastalis TaxID=3407671 RepID=UPI003B66CFCC
MVEIINGIQQIGLGVSNTKEVFNWYRKYLGFDILLFRDEATASLMTKYTNGKAERRDAYLSLNMKGGGGLEIWQFKDRIPVAPKTPVRFGDFGINAMKLRSADIHASHAALQKINLPYLGILDSNGTKVGFYFTDPWGNNVEVVEDGYSFSKSNTYNGGVLGVIIGVSDMERSLKFYQKLLGYKNVISDGSIEINTSATANKSEKFRQVILEHSRPKIGGFGELLGPTQIELLQALDREAVKIYKDRVWGDLGYIHICFDVQGMDILRDKAAHLNHPFTVDSAQSFDMGDAAGHFSYIEDPDGTLIEFVETHKVPIIKAMGLFLNLKKRNPEKPLPKWLVKTLRLHKISKNI